MCLVSREQGLIVLFKCPSGCVLTLNCKQQDFPSFGALTISEGVDLLFTFVLRNVG